MIRIALLLALLATPALAQQQTPSQVAIQVVTVVNGWAQMIEALQAENAKLKARVQELENPPAPAAIPGK